MNIKEVENIYRNSLRKYDDLYNYFINYCTLELIYGLLPVGPKLVRARDIIDTTRLKNINDLQYPPVSTNFSRIGNKNQIWFYASEDYETCLAEMLPPWYYEYKLGDKISVALSSWEITNNFKFVIIPDLSNPNEFSEKLIKKKLIKNEKYWSYICKKFRTYKFEDENIYQFTSAFSNAIIDRAKIENNKIDAIIYPSVQYTTKAKLNFAIQPSLIDDKSVLLDQINIIKCKKKNILNSRGYPIYDCNYDKEFERLGRYNYEKEEICWDN